MLKGGLLLQGNLVLARAIATQVLRLSQDPRSDPRRNPKDRPGFQNCVLPTVGRFLSAFHRFSINETRIVRPMLSHISHEALQQNGCGRSAVHQRLLPGCSELDGLEPLRAEESK